MQEKETFKEQYLQEKITTKDLKEELVLVYFQHSFSYFAAYLRI